MKLFTYSIFITFFCFSIPHVYASQTLSQLEKDLVSAQKELKKTEEKIDRINHEIATKEIERISNKVSGVQKKIATGALRSCDHNFSREREVLNQIIREVASQAEKAQDLLDQILTLITLESND